MQDTGIGLQRLQGLRRLSSLTLGLTKPPPFDEAAMLSHHLAQLQVSLSASSPPLLCSSRLFQDHKYLVLPSPMLQRPIMGKPHVISRTECLSLR